MKDIEVFEDDLLATAALGAWRQGCLLTELTAFFDAAHEAANLENGREILGDGRRIAVKFRTDLTVQYLGEGADRQGCPYHGFLFALHGRLQVLVWIEDDGVVARLTWRGDRTTFEEVALQFRQFSGAWLPEVDQAA